MKRHIFKSEHNMFRASFRKYLKDKIIPFYSEWEEAGALPKAVWREAGKHGWLCPCADEAYGGAEGDFLYSAIIQEELYYHGLPGVFWPVHSDIIYPYIERYATEDKKAEWLPRCITGESILAIAMTEPEVGSDLARLQTTAVRDGDEYVVNGSKTFISNGQVADLCVTAVRTSESERSHEGISLLVIESDR